MLPASPTQVHSSVDGPHLDQPMSSQGKCREGRLQALRSSGSNAKEDSKGGTERTNCPQRKSCTQRKECEEVFAKKEVVSEVASCTMMPKMVFSSWVTEPQLEYWLPYQLEPNFPLLTEFHFPYKI